MPGDGLMRPLRRREADLLRPQLAHFGVGSTLADPVLDVPNPSGVHIGDYVNIRPYAFLESLSPRGDVKLRIGNGTYIGPFVRITAVGGVDIGEKVLIADRCYISDTGHEYEDVSQPIIDQGLRKGRQLTIERGAWIGIGAAIVGNVTVGQGAVVGANCVVRHDVPPFTVVAGDPARIVRQYVDGRWVSVD
jgi:acetyltransferase-like isoleucine patch superfamily enzyme